MLKRLSAARANLYLRLIPVGVGIIADIASRDLSSTTQMESPIDITVRHSVPNNRQGCEPRANTSDDGFKVRDVAGKAHNGLLRIDLDRYRILH